MAKSFPFDAVLVDGAYDREFNSSDFASYFGKFIGDGVYAQKGNGLQVQADNTSMFITIKDGACFIKGRALDNSEDVSIRLENANSAYNRIDNVVAQLDLIERDLTIKVITGTASANPVAPTLTRNDDVYELLLATVEVASGVSAIGQSAITDCRSNNDVCGWVTGALQQIDAQSFFEQYELAFKEWFDNFKGVLEGDVATNLANQIAELDDTKADKSAIQDYTLLSANWVGDSAPFTYSATVTGVTATSLQEVFPSSSATTEQFTAWQGASVADGGQADNTLVLKAYGKKPTVDIPVKIVVRGDI